MDPLRGENVDGPHGRGRRGRDEDRATPIGVPFNNEPRHQGLFDHRKAGGELPRFIVIDELLTQPANHPKAWNMIEQVLLNDPPCEPADLGPKHEPDHETPEHQDKE